MLNNTAEKWFNGKTTVIMSIIEKLVIAALVGGLSVYGSYLVLNSRFESLCTTVAKLEKVADTLSLNLTNIQTRDAIQEYRINKLEENRDPRPRLK